MKPKLALLVFFVFFIPSHSLAQKEANKWYFGANAALDFNNGPPVSISGSAMNILEGCASIADGNGNLLFYTSGINIWNANNQIMPNGSGLLGHPSSTQSGVIIPDPGNVNRYYVITVPLSPNTGLRYSIVDMTLNSGLGDVTVKNVMLYAPVLEKVTAVMHANNQDIWVVSHRSNSDEYLSFLITSSGISLTPIISSIGATISTLGTRGQLKASPNGDKLCVALDLTNQFQVLDFDRATGIPSNPMTFSFTPRPYGVEFSQSGNVLYVSSWLSGITHLRQYDLLAGSQSLIQASEVTIHSSTYANGNFAAIQLGPDGKIYTIRDNQNALGVINAPDSLGLSCNYNHSGVTLSTGTCKLGLPNFLPSFFSANVTYFDTCYGDSTVFDVGNNFGVDSVLWNFGDTLSGPNDTSTQFVTKHLFSDTGIYNVELVIWFHNGIDTQTYNVYIYPLAEIDLGNDSILCPGDSIEVTSNSSLSMTYIWQDSSTLSTYEVNQPGTYWVEVTNICGTDMDTLVIDSIIPSHVDLGPDTIFCDGNTLTLDATVAQGTYLWNDSSTNATLDVDSTGIYWVKAVNVCQADSDTIVINVVTPPLIYFPPDTTLCFDTTVTLYASGNFTEYTWQDTTITDSFVIATPGATYWVEASNACGNYSDTVHIYQDTILNLQLGNDTIVCAGNSYIIDPITRGAVCLWHDGSTDSTLLVEDSARVWLEATNACGIYSDTVLIAYEIPPDIDLGPDTVLCNGGTVTLQADFSRSLYVWSNGTTLPTLTVTTTSDWWVQTTNLCGVDSDTISIIFDEPLDIDLGPDVQACMGDSITLDPMLSPTTSYVWSTGSTASSIVITANGRYKLTASNTCGVYINGIVAYFMPPPAIDLGDSAELCEGGYLELPKGEFVELHLWSDGTTGPGLVVEQPGKYTVRATNRCDTVYDAVQVTLRPLPYIELGEDTFYCETHGPVVFDLDTNLTYVWDNNSSRPYREIDVTGIYEVTVTDPLGCSSTDEIIINECPLSLYFPNAFTPNADGINDIFKAEGEQVLLFELRIYNRWGELIFQSNDINIGWDGTVQSVKAPVGAYSYNVRYKGESTGVMELLGKVHLER